ncbi:Gypsy retrotransposon integrase-like protein 1 [Tilletia horrida]|nr:Gypsy retrotransposon integrase-like protein 1 [Tilletia horrida]KAK0569110.1 Gypsy retrotransposon integrase-like protein 1 [Tilletia horrida]
MPEQAGSQSKKSGAKLAAAANASAAGSHSLGTLIDRASGPGATEDDHDAEGEGDDPNKRRRVARACDSCRKKKVRCDGIDPPHREACTNCSTYGHECTFLNAAKRRAPPRSYVDALEARMSKMETLLSKLAPGVDFTDSLGPPVLLPDAGDNPDENAIPIIGSNTTSTAQDITTLSTRLPTVPVQAVSIASGSGSAGFKSSDVPNPQQDQGIDEPENIGILLQHKYQRLSLEDSENSGHNHNHADHSHSHGTEADSDNSGVTPPEKAPCTDTKNPVQVLSYQKSMTHVSGAHDPDADPLDHGDTAMFFGHSSNFMLYPQLEKLTLGVPKSEKSTQRLRLVQDKCNIPDIYTETMGPPLENIDLRWPEPDLETRLVDAYFQYVHPSSPILNEFLFRHQLANEPDRRQERDWLNLCLGVFSVASRFVDDERLNTYSQQYEHARWLAGVQWMEARKALGFKLFHSDVSLEQLQGVILSAFFLQATPVGGTMGWALLGVAIRLLQAQGVHRRAVNRARNLPIHIDEQWKRCFWVCYHMEVDLSSNMGRPIGVHEDDFDLDFPLEVDDDVLWASGKVGARSATFNKASDVSAAPASTSTSSAPDLSSSRDTSEADASPSESSNSTPATTVTNSTNANAASAQLSGSASLSSTMTEIRDPSSGAKSPPEPVSMQGSKPTQFITTFNASLKLNMITARILRTIYMLPKARIARGYVGSQAPQFVVAEIDSALNDWIVSVPSRIRFDPHEPDDAILTQSSYVHLKYYNSQILTHRPFISGTRQDNPNFASVAICTNAARSSSHILDTLRKRGLLRRAAMPAAGHAFISGCVLLMVIWSAKKSGARLSSSTLADVHKCVEALKQMERSVHPATVLGAALTEMMKAAQIPFAEHASEQANHKRSHEDSVSGSSPISPTTSASTSAPTVPSPVGAQNRTARRRPKSGNRRSMNTSATSDSLVSDSGVPPLPLSTQQLVAPFQSSLSTASSPENGQNKSSPGQSRTNGPTNFAQSATSSTDNMLAQLQNQYNSFASQYDAGLANNGQVKTSGVPFSTFSSTTAPFGSNTTGSTPAQQQTFAQLMNNFSFSGEGGKMEAGSRSQAPQLDFASSSYDPMQLAAEGADFPLMGNPASWTSNSFNQASFPAFADVSAMTMGNGSRMMGDFGGMMGNLSGMTMPMGMGGSGASPLPGAMSTGGIPQGVPNVNNADAAMAARIREHAARQGDTPFGNDVSPEKCLSMFDDHILSGINGDEPRYGVQANAGANGTGVAASGNSFLNGNALRPGQDDPFAALYSHSFF